MFSFFYIINKKFNVLTFYRSDIMFHHLRNKCMHHMLTHIVHMEREQLKSSENFESSEL